MFKSLFKLAFVFTIFSSLFSCALSPDVMVVLDNSTKSYERAIRWGDFGRAKSFHKAAPTLSDLQRRRLKLYRVTDYKMLQNDTLNGNNAYLLVEIKYYKNDRPVIKSIIVKQHWKRAEKSEVWYIDSPFPDFK